MVLVGGSGAGSDGTRCTGALAKAASMAAAVKTDAVHDVIASHALSDADGAQ